MVEKEIHFSLARFISLACIPNSTYNIVAEAELFLVLVDDVLDAHVLGITGSAAAGKSTLIDKMIHVFRKDGLTVVVLAIDPTEASSGGSILADGMRMRDHYLDPGVFIRSFPSRGASSALTSSLSIIVGLSRLFADVVIVETAGAGQGDIRLEEFVDTFITLPETRGDSITLLKAGSHRHAHILAVNTRKESPEEKRFLHLLKGMQASFPDHNGWETMIFELNALSGDGVEEFIHDGIYKHRKFLKK